MIDSVPVIDAIVHPHNLHPDNYANRFAEPIVDAMATAHQRSPTGYRVSYDAFVRDWPMVDIANVTFLESYADLAVTHVLPIGAFKDGMCSLDKAVEAKREWPDRFLVYAGVDPLTGPAALDELDRQVELLDPVGVKLYPSSWSDNAVAGWRMDDPEIAFPVFERARQHNLKVVAVHKAVPLGPVPLDHYQVSDIDRAAMAFPELVFEVVHGGMAFVEETAWQLARFPNVYVNLEITTGMVLTAPRAFGRVLAGLLQYGGESAIKRIVWGSGLGFHPRPMLEAFVRDFAFEPHLVDGGGVPVLTPELKAGIIGQNYAGMISLDLPGRLRAVADDEFARRRGAHPLAPYSTTGVSGHVT